MLNRYGVKNYFQSTECREKCNSIDSIIKAQNTRRKNGTIRTSKIEKTIYDYINSEYKNIIIETNKRKYLNGLEIDIYLPEYKIGFEIQGDYFHKNPKFYKNPNEPANIVGIDKSITVQDIWDRDLKKFNLAKEKGIEIIYLWEYDIKYNFQYIKKIIDENINLHR